MRYRANHRSVSFIATLAGAILWLGCSDDPAGPITGRPAFNASIADVRAAIAAQERHTPVFLAMPGVVGTAVGLNPGGQPVVQVFLTRADNAPNLPSAVDGVPLVRIVTGPFHALSDPTLRMRPAPVGFSVGHLAITAGTIGARVLDGAGSPYVLSNNHVLANSNGATLGDAILQPGPFDGGTNPADRIATLYDFQVLDFSGANNTIDAAIAQTTFTEVGSSTPTDDGYGQPSSDLFGDANHDGTFDDIAMLLNLAVQKYGRTTKLTKGAITGINATLNVCYEVVFIFCTTSAHFVNQLIITPGGFSGGGDSGSMIVTDDASKNPVALLFAGSSTNTVANRMDLVLRRFNVRIDDGGAPPPPPPPSTDLAIHAVSAPSSVTQGDAVTVNVTVRNAGTENVASDVLVTLTDQTATHTIGNATISGGLTAGASTVLSYTWDTSATGTGAHTLTASHDFADDNAANNTRSTVVAVNAPVQIGLHFGDLDATSTNQGGGRWVGTVTMTAHGPNHETLASADLGGLWFDNVEFTCTTNAQGQCTATRVFRNKVSSMSFLAVGIVFGLTPFTPEVNHDPDGDSDGTIITVRKPQ